MIRQFFEIGDSRLALFITALLFTLILALIVSIFSKKTEKTLRSIHILESNENPKELLYWIIGIMLLIRITHIYIAQPFIVDGDSMYPNLHSGEILIVDKVGYRLHDPKIGDIVVFRYHDPYHKCLDKAETNTSYSQAAIDQMCVGVATDPYDGKYLVKRIVALPKTTIKYEGKTLIAKEDQYIVMGDNRAESYDSRAWGALDARYISGRVVTRVWPLSRAAWDPAPLTDPINLK